MTLRKIHFSKLDIWKYYFKNNHFLVIFSPNRKRYQTTILDFINWRNAKLGIAEIASYDFDENDISAGIIPSEIKQYIQEKLK